MGGAPTNQAKGVGAGRRLFRGSVHWRVDPPRSPAGPPYVTVREVISVVVDAGGKGFNLNSPCEIIPGGEEEGGRR